MRFELFDGAMTVAVVAFEAPATIRLRVRPSEHRAFLVEYFAGEPVETDHDALEIIRDEWSPVEFERAVLDLRRLRSLQVVSRPATDEP